MPLAAGGGGVDQFSSTPVTVFSSFEQFPNGLALIGIGGESAPIVDDALRRLDSAAAVNR